MATNIKCMDCGGAGKIQAFSHISGGICFSCDGTGREDIATAKQVAKGEAPRCRNTFVYVMPNGDFRMFVIYPDGSSNVGTVADARKACRAVIAKGGELIETTEYF
ncbi:MAG: hypothetical protein GY814_06020 [Gammaproteobacteria bacterium]|nr:hypothetical protein [Gammaproteobacteria bacterium]